MASWIVTAYESDFETTALQSNVILTLVQVKKLPNAGFDAVAR